MPTFTYNDITFSVARGTGNRWDVAYALPNGSSALAAANLFAGLPESEAFARARALITTIFPTGIRCVGPDVNHPNTIGDLKIVGPDVNHPNFIYWNKDSTSCPVNLRPE